MTITASAERGGSVGAQGGAGKTFSADSSASSAYEVDQDNAYLAELLSYSLDRLNKEPALLAEDHDCVRRQMQDCAASHHRSFVEASECLFEVRNCLGYVDSHLKGLTETLPTLEEACSQFSERAATTVEKRMMHKQLQSTHGRLLELLEVPQLMDTCVRNSTYDEALDLEAFVSKLAFLHPELKVVQGLQQEAKAISSELLTQLLKRLSGSIQLPECLRVIGFLRRLSAFSEQELRLQFLRCREQWLVEMVEELDNNNPYDYLKRLTDIHRLHLFDIVMQYKAIFSDEAEGTAAPGAVAVARGSQILTSWAQHRICLYLDALRLHLPSIKEGGSLSSVLEHSMYCGMSLGRVGLDFRGLLPPVFETCIAALFSTALTNALDNFYITLDRHKWMPMPVIPYAAKRSVSGKSVASLESENVAAEGEDVASENTSPPQVLMEHAPLAVFVNGLLHALNELRYCIPLELGKPVAQSLQDAVFAVSSSMAHFHATRVLGESEAPVFESACQVVIDDMVPYIASCFANVYPGGAPAIDAAAAVTPLQDIMSEAKARDATVAQQAAQEATPPASKLKKTKSVTKSVAKSSKPAVAAAKTLQAAASEKTKL